MTSRSHKSRRTTVRNVKPANNARQVAERVVGVDDPLHPHERLRRLRRAAVWVVAVVGGFALYLLWTSDIRASEPTRRATTSSLRWKRGPENTSGTTSAASPGLLSDDVAAAARPLVESTSKLEIRRDENVVLAQAVDDAVAEEDPLKDPFGDKRPAAPPTIAPPAAAPRIVPMPASPGDLNLPKVPDADTLAKGSAQVQEKCPQLADLKQMSAITNRIAASPGDIPQECTIDDNVIALHNRAWGETIFTWKASGLCHKPLYFEEEALERYGHSTGRFSQPIVSAFHFWLTVPVLPYKMAIDPPNECKYALGYYRPGSCAPWIIPPVPVTARAVAAETAAVLGLVYIIP